jgi:hypothetical protein
LSPYYRSTAPQFLSSNLLDGLGPRSCFARSCGGRIIPACPESSAGRSCRLLAP